MTRLWLVAIAWLSPWWLVLLVLDYTARTPSTGSATLDKYLNGLGLFAAFSHVDVHADLVFFVGWALFFLVLALCRDALVMKRARALLAPVRYLLDGGSSDQAEVSQKWNGSALYTRLSGSFRGRDITVTFWKPLGSRSCAFRDVFRVSFECQPPWEFEVRKKSLATRVAEVFRGDSVSIGDSALQDKLVFCGSDAEALIEWVRRPEVRQGLVSLMSLDSFILGDGPDILRGKTVPESEPVLEAVYDDSMRTVFKLWTRALVLNDLPRVLHDMGKLAGTVDGGSSLDGHGASRFCAGCGAPLKPNMSFCENCGRVWWLGLC